MTKHFKTSLIMFVCAFLFVAPLASVGAAEVLIEETTEDGGPGGLGLLILLIGLFVVIVVGVSMISRDNVSDEE